MSRYRWVEPTPEDFASLDDWLAHERIVYDGPASKPWVCMHGVNVTEAGDCAACRADLAGRIARARWLVAKPSDAVSRAPYVEARSGAE